MDYGRNGYLYLIHCVGFPYYKIGITKDIDARLSSMQSSLPFQLELEFAVLAENFLIKERELHSKYANNRLNGEWFNFNDAELDDVKTDLIDIERYSDAPPPSYIDGGR